MSLSRREFVEREGGLYLEADWMSPVFLHYRFPPECLRGVVPFELELWEGSAWVTLVAFTLEGFRPSVGGGLGRLLFRPFREQRFLNVRTYVRHGGVGGIHFLAEWISDWCNAKLGPLLYSLPYRHGRLNYRDDGGDVRGVVKDATGELAFHGRAKGRLESVAEGTREHFLLERYFAFNAGGPSRRWFAVCHDPWRQCEASVEIPTEGLLQQAFAWWGHGRFVSANYSPGALGVLMGRPHRM